MTDTKQDMMEDKREHPKTENLPKIEVGCGAAKGDDSYAAGFKAAGKALAGITSHRLSAVIVFASASYQLDEVLSGIRAAVGRAPIFGASSAGEICNGTLSESVSVTALASPFLSVGVGIGKEVSTDWRKAIHAAIDSGGLNRYFTPQDGSYYNSMTLEGRSAFAILFSPASTSHSDSYSPEILEELKRLSLGRLLFFGGAAVDAEKTSGHENFIFYNDQVCSDSMILAVFETTLRFGIAMGHGLHPTAKRARITKVRGYEVLELDGRRAADVFAEFHDLKKADLESKPLFEQNLNHLGMRDALGHYTIFTPRCFTPEGGILLAHPAPEGAFLVLMEAVEDDMIAAGKNTLRRAMMQSGINRPAAILVCSCFLRMLLLGNRIDEEIAAITDIMPGTPVTGFYSAGEQGSNDDHISRHNNESIVILLLGNELSYAAQVAGENRIMQRALEFRISEQKRLEKELADQVRFLQTLIKTIPSPVFYKDQQGRYLGCNRAFEEYNHISRTYLRGKSNWDFLPRDQAELHCKVDADLAEKGGKAVYECSIAGKDGELFHFLNNKAVFHRADGSLGGIVGVLVDITDRKNTEEALRASEEKFLKAFHNNPTMMIICTADEGRVIEVNDSCLRIMGFTRLEMMGKTSGQLNIHACLEQRDTLLRMMEEKGSVRNVEIALRTKSGEIRHCLFSAEQIQLQKGNHILLLLQDVTDQKRSEEERLQRIRLQSILNMAGTICHEFNQPMQVLSGYIDLLLSRAWEDPKVHGNLLKIKEQTARMTQITRKLMTLNDPSVQDYAGIGKIVNLNGDQGK